MPTVDALLISRLEKLARLQLSQTERERMADDLSAILKMVEKLGELPTEGVEPLCHLTEDPMPPRADRSENGLTAKEALENAPKSNGRFFSVPKTK